jgi:hypothetical protein
MPLLKKYYNGVEKAVQTEKDNTENVKPNRII